MVQETKEQYVTRMLNIVDKKLATETWSEFRKNYYTKYGEEPNYWRDFMQLRKAGITDLQILSSIDDNFRKFVVDDPNILNDEVKEEMVAKTKGKISDHIQFDIEGGTGEGKSTLMLALCLENWEDFCVNDIHFLKRDLLNYVSDNSDKVRKSVACLDEDVKSRGIGASRSDGDLEQLFESCRKAGLSYCGCHAIRKHENQTVFYRFLVFAKNVSRRLTCACVYRKDICIGFIQVRIPYTEKFFELEYDYNLKKDDFITKTMKQENKEIIDIDKYANELLKSPLLKTSEKVTKKLFKLIAYELINNLTKDEQEIIILKSWILWLEQNPQ